MRPPPGPFFGNARVRALRSRLLSGADAFRLRSATTLSALAQAVGLEPVPAGPAQFARGIWPRFIDDCQKVRSSFRRGPQILAALIGVWEVENLKLAWRARSRGAPPSWVELWRPFGSVESLPLDPWREAASLAEAVAACDGSPWGGAAKEALAAHGRDPHAAELALDRYAWRRLGEEARQLPRSERRAQRLVRDLVEERDWNTIGRGVGVFGWSPDVALAMAVELPRRFRSRELRPALEWRPADGPLGRRLPRSLSLRDPGVLGWDDWISALRRHRLAASRRAFRRSPFGLAAAIALLLLRNAEVRALVALAEAIEGGDAAGAVVRTLAASAIGET
jgi:vacuolar-type H+-ATPase subunit C/Vma6